jgi:tetratricopeptide (TPR) repeat protein
MAGVVTEEIIASLTHAPERSWLERGRELVFEGQLQAALAVFSEAAKQFPASAEIGLGIAGLHWQMGQHAQAEALLKDRLASHPDDIAATFLLVRFLRELGRLRNAASVMRQLFDYSVQSVETAIQAVELLDDYGCVREASAICETAIASGSDDPRLHAYAGMLGIQLGEFERVREHYLFALAHSTQAVEWNIPSGLAVLQRYNAASHSDFAFFREVLTRPGLSEKARTETLFALGKAHDDLADFAQAVVYFRHANARAHASSHWSRKQWKRSIEARIGSKPYTFALPSDPDWTPIFVVGVPRSGTTVLAALIAKYPLVCNRGELGWLQALAHQLAGFPRDQAGPFKEAAARYAMQLRQEDLESRWFIDKQPLNLLHIDLIMALWPNARIIYCERDARDTALSLWSQSFHDPAHDYAYDFSDIAAVIRGCRRLMTQWLKRYPSSIKTVRYEALVAAPDETLGKLADWLGLPADTLASAQQEQSAIGTASVWQARQPIHAHSAGRWRNYESYLPELKSVSESG